MTRQIRIILKTSTAHNDQIKSILQRSSCQLQSDSNSNSALSNLHITPGVGQPRLASLHASHIYPSVSSSSLSFPSSSAASASSPSTSPPSSSFLSFPPSSSHVFIPSSPEAVPLRIFALRRKVSGLSTGRAWCSWALLLVRIPEKFDARGLFSCVYLMSGAGMWASMSGA